MVFNNVFKLLAQEKKKKKKKNCSWNVLLLKILFGCLSFLFMILFHTIQKKCSQKMEYSLNVALKK